MGLGLHVDVERVEVFALSRPQLVEHLLKLRRQRRRFCRLGVCQKGLKLALGCRTGPAPTCSAALELIWSNAPDIVFVDTQLGSETREAVVNECRLLGIPIIVTHEGEQGTEPSCCHDSLLIDKSYT